MENRRFIYLRQTGNGRESGYARLENGDGALRLSVVVQGFGAIPTVNAALVHENSLQELGILRFDSTGRGGLTTTVSPETVAQASLLAVVREDNGIKDIPLAAVMGNGKAVQLQAVLRELNRTEETPAALQPEPVSEVVSVVAEKAEGVFAPESDRFEQVEQELRTPLVTEPEGDVPEPLRAVYWPQRSWPMVDLFEKFPVTATPGGAENRTCVKVPLSGMADTPDHYLLGVETEDNRVTALGMLLPGTETDAEYSALPDYVWADGYWQLWQPISE